MTNNRGGIGEPYGVPTAMGENLFGGTLGEEPAFSIGEETAYPGDDVPVGPLGSKGGGELRRVNSVEPSLDVEEKGGDFAVHPLEMVDCVGQSGGGVES